MNVDEDIAPIDDKGQNRTADMAARPHLEGYLKIGLRQHSGEGVSGD